MPPTAIEKTNDGVLNFSRLQEIAEYQLQALENNGYPFAKLQLGDYRIENDTLYGELQLRPGPFVRFDSIVVKGFERFPKRLIRYNLELRDGLPYNEELLQSLIAKTQKLEYLTHEPLASRGFY
ncbi:MAG: hypothetical protein U5L96_05335 [Owenweeksia sp.]|nr:hypothetical protein [Owenweeksia sp.]